ncbi:MAG: chaperonin GroEL [Candidatus Shikimatogenerans sp. AspAUS03]|uniref:Chaperonin GroEL n=1 Tax=Candidatus Shikimatogenerans sp. AspAUS03 TaxID=3158563 RepID=A0AAU7QSA7_9FLAO
MNKQIIFGNKARNKLKKGINILSNAVKITLGPKGRNVILDKSFLNTQITKDGVTVAKEIFLKDKIENLGAQIIKDIASKTNDLAGDGTTTATLLAQYIINESLKNVSSGCNPINLKTGILKSVDLIVKGLKKQSKNISNNYIKIQQIASISANNDKNIGKLIAKAFKVIGKNGIITIEESKTIKTYINIVKGMQLNTGYESSYFITNSEKMVIELDNPYILITDKKIISMKFIIKILEKISKLNKSLLIISEEIEGEVLTNLVVNKIRGIIKIASIKAPGFGDKKKEILKDIAILTGGKYLSEDLGLNLKNIQIKDLGKAKKIIITKDNTIIIKGLGESQNIKDRIKQIKNEIKISNSNYEINKLKRRVAKLIGGIAVIYVGANSELEMKEKKDRIEDALNATKAAIEEGIVPGGGIALIRCIKYLNKLKFNNYDKNLGVSIMKLTLEQPLIQILRNSGISSSLILNRIKNKKNDFGYDAKKGKYKYMIKEGIVDPTKVTRIAIENAAYIGSMLITTECVICEKKKKNINHNNFNNNFNNPIG